MKSNRSLVRYKHDVVGKFKEISSVITPLSDNEEVPSNYFELFGIVHGLLMKMITTSRESMAELFTQECKLFVVSELPHDLKLTKLLIDDCEVFQSPSPEGLIYYFPIQTIDTDRAIFNLGKVKSILPISEIVIKIPEDKLRQRLEKII